ncbi:lysozyme [Rouxiella silvae]|uniref:Lysozyme n=1 Tax=Rouxiella silvae TaxID=1646373 RepID=A0AA40WYY9_9GAMM|nr:lysozyme [Rouxiella silvae]MBF6635571.1 lysozyme [Rouxiella silvae]
MSIKKKAVTCLVAAIISIMGVKYAGEVRTSVRGLELIGDTEGCRRDPYLCPANVLTAGIGSTSGISVSHLYSDAEIAAMWVEDLQRAERCINKNFHGDEMNQNQFDAMASAAFNMGCLGLMWFTDSRGVRQRTTIWKHAQARSWAAMCNRLPDFVNGGGRKLPGLVKRREAERVMCLEPVT